MRMLTLIAVVFLATQTAEAKGPKDHRKSGRRAHIEKPVFDHTARAHRYHDRIRHRRVHHRRVHRRVPICETQRRVWVPGYYKTVVEYVTVPGYYERVRGRRGRAALRIDSCGVSFDVRRRGPRRVWVPARQKRVERQVWVAGYWTFR